MRGGDTVAVGKVAYITRKARAMYAKISPTGYVEDIAPQPGDLITLLGDSNPFFIHESGPYRVVLCVAKGHKLESGRFVIVDVQKRKRK